jgi:subtilisin-like proprotein convertase family protein
VIVNQICFGQLYASPLNNQSLCPCGFAIFETIVGTPDPVTFLWRHNGQIIAGATSNSIILYGLKPADTGTYTVEIRTPCRAMTNSANLALLPVIGVNPVTFSSSSSIDILDDTTASPYPSEIDVQCVPGRVKNVTVTLTGYEHAYPSDVGALLVAPDGDGIPLMSDAGGNYLISNTTLTFSDAATNYLPAQDIITNGLYLPSDYNPGEFGDLATVTNFAAFTGTDPNGAWQLYVLDDMFGDAGSIAGWSVNIEWDSAAPELINPRILTNGDFQADVLSLLGVTYIVQGSTDFKTWTTLSTNAADAVPSTFTDSTSPGHPYRFYRVFQCP